LSPKGVISCETQRLALPQLGRLRFYVIEFFFITLYFWNKSTSVEAFVPKNKDKLVSCQGFVFPCASVFWEFSPCLESP
jgi:hypothetical protein